MNLSIAAEIFRTFPEAAVGVIVARDVGPIPRTIEEQLKVKAAAAISALGQAGSVASVPHIKEWRDAIRQMRLSASDVRSSIEQLTRRALAGRLHPVGVEIVDAYCNISIVSSTPIGGYDVAKLNGDVVLRHGHTGEVISPLGSVEDIVVDDDVVIYSDDENVLCYAWNHRDSRKTCIDGATRDVLFTADAISRQGRSQMSVAVQLLRELVIYSGGTVSSFGTATKDTPTLSLL